MTTASQDARASLSEYRYARSTRRGQAPEGPSGERLLAGWANTGRPTCLRDHVAFYGLLPAFAATTPDHRLIEAVSRAGLTGRGGAGFLTAVKLRAVAGHKRAQRVVVANGMESEPVSAKDKALLQLAPHTVLDGIVAAAKAVGAARAHLCVARTQDGLDRRLRELIDERRAAGLDAVDIRVHTPPHHYVASEASAVVNWLGGGEAKPATTPPRTAERGVDGLPTLVDNVETLAHIALIARYGPQWYRSRGTREAPGTALVTLTGAVTTPGVYEVGFGTPLRDVLALGTPQRDAQAVLVGGYFGTWLPISKAQTLEFSAPGLAAAGASPGAGALAVLPHTVCALAETARILEYLAAHSARQCGPCRFGLPATAQGFSRLAFSRLDRDAFTRLDRNISLLAGRGACKHPDGAAHLAASALRAFAPEVRRHLQAGPCPAALHAAPVLPTPSPPADGGDWL